MRCTPKVFFFERTCAGIPNGSRARSILFLGSTLQKQNSAYPAIGQKKLNGAASRMMVHFGAVVSHEIEAEHPSAIHRLGFVKGKKCKTSCFNLYTNMLCISICLILSQVDP